MKIPLTLSYFNPPTNPEGRIDTFVCFAKDGALELGLYVAGSFTDLEKKVDKALGEKYIITWKHPTNQNKYKDYFRVRHK